MATALIFPPGNRESQRSLLDADGALPFANRWGRGRRLGPPLNTYDEDTLIALLRLMHFSPQTDGSWRAVSMPNTEPRPMVYALFATLADIQREDRAQRSGPAHKLRLASIKRLAATKVEIEFDATNAVAARSREFALIELYRGVCNDDGVLYLQFPPRLSQLFVASYFHVDINVRRQLTDTGKAVHRFLSEQPRCISIETDRLQQSIGYARSTSHFMRDLRNTMQRLKSLRWLTGWEIEGTGRSRPFLLRLKRRREGPADSPMVEFASQSLNTDLKEGSAVCRAIA